MAAHRLEFQPGNHFDEPVVVMIVWLPPVLGFAPPINIFPVIGKDGLTTVTGFWTAAGPWRVPAADDSRVGTRVGKGGRSSTNWFSVCSGGTAPADRGAFFTSAVEIWLVLEATTQNPRVEDTASMKINRLAP